MKFPTTLIKGKLVKRYKRFLADIELDDGNLVTTHCANPGSMLGLKKTGSTVWLSKHDNPKRKLAYSWELMEVDLGAGPYLVGINTSLPNAIVCEAITTDGIEELGDYAQMRREVKYGQSSRIDILLEDRNKPCCYVEVKNVHLMRQYGLAEFPDSVTKRGTKHLQELASVVENGKRAVMFYLIQRGDADNFSLARDIDPTYGQAFDKAIDAGVEIICYDCILTLEEISLGKKIPMKDFL